MFGRRAGYFVSAIACAVISSNSAQAASPRQTVLLGPILDNSIAFGGGPGSGLNSSAASGTNGVLLNFDTDTTGGASDQVAFEWESFDTDLSSFSNFSLNINPAAGFQVGGAQVFIRSEDPLSPGTQDFAGGPFTPLTAGVNNLVTMDLSAVDWPENVIGFGIQLFTNNFSIPGASAVVSTAAEFTVTNDVIFDFNEGNEGWETGFQPGHTHSLVPTGAADGTQALGIDRDRDATTGSFTWGSQRRFVADPDGDGPLPVDPSVVAQIADLEARINAADAIAFDITIKDPFPASPGFAGFHLEMTDSNNFYQGPGQFFAANPEGGVQTNTYLAQLSNFVGQNTGQPGGGLPVTELGFQADGFVRFTIASNTDGDGIYELDNFRLIDQEVITSADFDIDGDVDADDLARWRTAYGVNNDGDADFDGDTDGRDFLIWQRQFGGAGLAAVTVPEPASVIAVVFCCACLVVRRR